MTPLLSVIVPVYCNETTLQELRDRIVATLEPVTDLDFEIVFVDDASTDGSWKLIEQMALVDSRVSGVRLKSNVGQLRASCASLEVAHGDVFLSMDADLEHPPEAIPDLLGEFGRGHDLVVARRVGRVSRRSRFLGSAGLNLLARAMRLPTTDIGSSFLLCTARVAVGMRDVVDKTGRQMVLPAVFRIAFDPTLVTVEAIAESPSAYQMLTVMRLGGEFLTAELAPVAGRWALVASGVTLGSAVRAPTRRRLFGTAAALAALGVAGLLAPLAFRRGTSEPLYEVADHVGRPLQPKWI